MECIVNRKGRKVTEKYIREQLARARRIHPEFPENPAEALCIISEELGELAQAINDTESKERLKEEASHVAVTAIRFIEELEKWRG